MEKNDKKITYRTYFIALAMILMLIVIAVKLVTIQIEGDTYRAKVDEKTLREAEITPTQGNLYSDDGSLLATSVTRYDIRWDSKAPSKKLFKENIKQFPALKNNVDKLIALIKKKPFQTPPPYEALIGDLKGYYSRRINKQHRLVYEVIEDEKRINIISMWKHYEF